MSAPRSAGDLSPRTIRALKLCVARSLVRRERDPRLVCSRSIASYVPLIHSHTRDGTRRIVHRDEHNPDGGEGDAYYKARRAYAWIAGWIRGRLAAVRAQYASSYILYVCCFLSKLSIRAHSTHVALTITCPAVHRLSTALVCRCTVFARTVFPSLSLLLLPLLERSTSSPIWLSFRVLLYLHT